MYDLVAAGTDQQLIDPIAVGQFPPGPVFTTSTLIGYVVAGFPCAIPGTIGIFLPSFLLVAVGFAIIPRLRSSSWTAGFLDEVNVASLGLMAAVTWQLGRAALMDDLTIVLELFATLAVLMLCGTSAWRSTCSGEKRRRAAGYPGCPQKQAFLAF